MLANCIFTFVFGSCHKETVITHQVHSAQFYLSHFWNVGLLSVTEYFTVWYTYDWLDKICQKKRCVPSEQLSLWKGR